GRRGAAALPPGVVRLLRVLVPRDAVRGRARGARHPADPLRAHPPVVQSGRRAGAGGGPEGEPRAATHPAYERTGRAGLSGRLVPTPPGRAGASLRDRSVAGGRPPHPGGLHPVAERAPAGSISRGPPSRRAASGLTGAGEGRRHRPDPHSPPPRMKRTPESTHPNRAAF